MKTVLLLVASLSLMVVVGCESPRGGGISGGEGFKIGTPMLDTKMKQGEIASVTIKLHRGEYFKRDVRLDITSSKGIAVEPTQTVVKANEKPDVHLKITVATDAALGEYKVFVKGTPETGEATSTEFTVKVVSP